MKIFTINDRNYKIPTDAGAALGIFREERIIRGAAVKVSLYGMEAQKLIALNALKILEFKK